MPDNLPAVADASQVDNDFADFMHVLGSDPYSGDGSDGTSDPVSEPAQPGTQVATREAPQVPTTQQPAPTPVARSAGEPPTTASPAPDRNQGIAQVLDRIRQGQQPTVRQPAPAPVQTQQQPAPAAPQGPVPYQYALTVPPDIVAMLRSEDPGQHQQGLNTLVSSLANVVHNTLRAEYKNEVAQAVSWAVRQADARANATIQRHMLRADFYGAFPDLNHKALFPLVEQISQQISMDTGAKEWTPELRDKIGQAVRDAVYYMANGRVPEPVQQPAPNVVPIQQQQPARQPPRANFTPGARPAAPAPGTFADEWSAMASVVNGR